LNLTITDVHVMCVACQYLLRGMWDIVGGVYARTWSPCTPVYTQKLYSSLYKSAVCIFMLEGGLKRDGACTSENLVTKCQHTRSNMHKTTLTISLF